MTNLDKFWDYEDIENKFMRRLIFLWWQLLIPFWIFTAYLVLTELRHIGYFKLLKEGWKENKKLFKNV